MCEYKSVNFLFCVGKQNPADFVTRAVSYKQLMKSNYISGISVDEMTDMNNNGFANFQIPVIQNHVIETRVSSVKENSRLCDIYEFERASSFNKVVSVMSLVLKFINKLKIRSNSVYSRN